MKAILFIDYRPFLFESQSDAMKVMSLLSKSASLEWDHADVNHYVKKEAPELKLEACGKRTVILTTDAPKKRRASAQES